MHTALEGMEGPVRKPGEAKLRKQGLRVVQAAAVAAVAAADGPVGTSVPSDAHLVD